MKICSTIVASLAVSVALAAVPVSAHHSTAAFYTDEIVEVTGQVAEFLYVNPHGQLVIQDAAGAYWVGEMGNVLGLQRQGLTKATLPPGTGVTLKALSSRDGTNRVLIRAIAKDGVEIYAND